MSDEKKLPRGWLQAPLAELIEPRGDKILPAEMPTATFLGMDHVEAHTTRIIGGLPAIQMKSAAARFYKGDVLYGRLRPYLNKVAQPTFDGLASAEFMVFPDTELVKGTFLKYRLNASDFVTFASHLNEGDRPRVGFDQIGSFPIFLPPPTEQLRIVAKVDELFSELDKGVESLTTVREQLKAYRQAVLKHAFEGKLTADWRVTNPDRETGATFRQRVLSTRRHEWEKAERARLKQQEHLSSNDRWKARYPEPEDFDDEDLPTLPDEWCWAGLDELVSGKLRSMQSGPFGSNLLHSEFQTSGVLVLGIDNVRDGTFSMGSQNRISKEKFQELEKYQARPGDLLVTVMASLGRTCIVPRDLEKAIITKHVYRISMEEQLLFPEYFNLLLQSQTVSRSRMFENAQGQTRPGLNSSILKALPIPLCSRKEQVEIVSRLSSQLSNIDSMIAQIDDELSKTTMLRHSILKRAFSGQLVIQHQSDEPASVLMERIRAKKGEGGSVRQKNKNGKKEAA